MISSLVVICSILAASDSVYPIPRIAVVEGQWASYRKDEAGQHRQCIRQGTLIGNKWLIDEGITPNQVKDWRDPSETNLDYIFCQPMTIFGKNMGIPEILYRYQNLIDAYQTKILEWMAQAKGTFYVINSSVVDPTTDANEIMAEISDKRVVVVKGTDIDAGDTMKKLMEQGAIEVPRDTVLFINQIDMYRNLMGDILNIPPPVRGQLEGYQAQKTLAMQKASSSKGTRYFYEPMYKFYSKVFQKAVDKFKVSTMDNPDFEYTLIVSDSQVEQFKAGGDYGTSREAVYIDFEDLADDSFKERQLMLIQTAIQAQSGGIGYTLSDAANIEQMTTKLEIINYMQQRDYEIAQQRQAEAERQERMAMAQAQQNNATQLEINAMNNEGADAREAAEIESKEKIEAMKVASKEMAQ